MRLAVVWWLFRMTLGRSFIISRSRLVKGGEKVEAVFADHRDI